MSKKSRRIHTLKEIHKNILLIRDDAKNQTTKSIEMNMETLAESIHNVLEIDLGEHNER